MRRDLGALAAREHDLLVVGGGIHAAVVAWDAAQRGLKVALVEARDLASGVSWNSLKTIHGGLRYLQTLDLRRMRSATRERSALLRIAPELVCPLPFLVPVYRGAKRGMFMIRVGMKLYDLLTPGKRTEHYRTISRNETVRLERHLEPQDLRGSGYYFETTSCSCPSACAWRTSRRRSGGGPLYTTTPRWCASGGESREPRAESRVA